MSRAVGVTLVLVCVAWSTVWSINYLVGEREHYFGGIACSDVRANVNAFAMGTLSDELAGRIQIHLAECPSCQKIMEQMNQAQVSAVYPQPAAESCLLCPLRQIAERALSSHVPADRQRSEDLHVALVPLR